MKKSIFLLLFIFCLAFTGYAQEATSARILKQAVSLKPTNFSNIDINDRAGYHFGIAYERLLGPNSHWSWVLPITYAVYNTFLITDYKQQGHSIYISPGVKYYLKSGNPLKGWSASFNLLAGTAKYDYSSRMRRGNAQLAFYGVLGTWLYNAPISKTAAFNFELGFGLKNTHYQSDYKESQDFPPYDYINSIDKWYLSGIMNVSVGISKWF